MRAGPRDRRVRFETATWSRDDHGGKVSTWSLLANPWCSVRFGTGEERREAAQRQATAPATFYALWTPTLAALSTQDRIAGFMGANWEIVSVIPVGRNKEIEILAVRTAA